MVIIIIIIFRQENLHILTLLLPFPVQKKGFSDHNEVHNLIIIRWRIIFAYVLGNVCQPVMYVW